jgi:serine/threonine protein kinase/WD40 repeat protein
MSADPSALLPDPLNKLRTSGTVLSTAEVSAWALTFLAAVEACHNAGRLHGGVNAGGPARKVGEVDPVPETIWILNHSLDLPAEVRKARIENLPLSQESAREKLAEAGVQFSPRELELYVVGGVICRLLTGEGMEAWLRSAQLKGRVAREWQRVINRLTGSDGEPRFASAGEARAAIEAVETVAQPGARRPPVEPDTTPSVAVASPDTDTGNPRRTSSEELPFQRLGHYDVLERIGQGGMGDVYKAREPQLDRIVALKVLPPELARQTDFVRRFRAEATAVARLTHPHVVQVYFVGEDSGTHYFAMQYIEGETLSRRLARKTRLPVDQAIVVIEHCLMGLAAAHDVGLIHRDIKPGNILIDAIQKKALLSDFGLVKSLGTSTSERTLSGVVMGTVDYISPEQGRGLAVDVRSDLYSIGVMFYQMLAGRLPFEADSATAMIFQHVYEPPPPLRQFASDVPEPIATLILRLMAKSPADRHGSAREVLSHLRDIRKGKVPPAGGEIAESGSSKGRQQTVIVRLPEFEADPIVHDSLPPELMALPEDAESAAGIVTRVGRMARAIAPDLFERLQSTSQQVDGAIHIYAERARKLNELATEADSILAELRRNAQSARKRVEEGTSDEQRSERRQLLAQAEATCREQESQCRQIGLRRDEARARLQILRSQRDALQARLKTAEAQRRVEHGGPGRGTRRNVRWRVGAAVAALLGLGLVMLGLMWVRGTAPTLVMIDSADSISISRFTPSEPDTPDIAVDEAVKSPEATPPSRPLQGVGIFAVGDGNTPFPGLIPKPATLTGVRRWQIVPSRQPRFKYDLADVAWNPKHPVVAAAYTNGEIRLMDPVSRKVTAVWIANQSDPLGQVGKRDIAWSPDGERLVCVGSDGSLTIWDRLGWIVRRPIDGGNPMHRIAWHPDGSRFVTSGRDGILRVWSAAGDEAGTLGPDSFPAGNLVWSPDGQLLAAQAGKQIRVFDKTGAIAHELEVEPNYDQHMAWSGGGQFLAVTTQGGKLEWRHLDGHKYEEAVPQRSVSGLVSTADGSLLATSGEAFGSSEILVWDREAKLHSRIPTRAVCLDFSPDSRSLVLGSNSGRVVIADVLSGKINIIQEDSLFRYSATEWNPEGSVLASACPGGTVRFWNPEGDLLNVWHGSNPATIALAWNHEGTWLAKSGRQAGVHGRLYQGDQNSNRDFSNLQRENTCLAWSPDAKHLAVGTSLPDKVLCIFENKDFTPRVEFPQEGPMTSLAWSSDGKRLAGTVQVPFKSEVRIWNVENPLKPEVTDFRFEPEQGCIISKVAWNPVIEDRLLLVGQSHARRKNIFVVNSKDGSLLASCNGHAAKDIQGASHAQVGSWSPDGKMFATGATDGSLLVWNADCTPVTALMAHLAPIYGLSWAGNRIATVSVDGTVIVWNTADWTPAWTLVTPTGTDDMVEFTGAGVLTIGNRGAANERLVAVVEHPDGRQETLSLEDFWTRYPALKPQLKIPELPSTPNTPTPPPSTIKATTAEIAAALKGVRQLLSVSRSNSAFISDLDGTNGKQITVAGDVPADKAVATTLNLYDAEGISDEQMALIGLQKHATQVSMSRYTGNGDGLKILSGLPSLKSLDLSQTTPAMKKIGIKHLGDCRNLERLLFSSPALDDEAVGELRGLTKLRDLSLGPSNMSGHALRNLPTFPELRSLVIAFNPNREQPSKADFGVLDRLPKLTYLSINASPHITGEGLSGAAPHPTIKGLSIFPANGLTAAGVREIAKTFPRLESLTLPNFSIAATDGFDALAEIGQLKGLTLSGSTLTAEAIEQIGKLQTLQFLSCDGSNGFDDLDLAPLAEMSLKSFSAGNTRLGDSACASLARMKSLEQLSLGDTRITAKGLTALIEAKSLKHLLIVRCDISPKDAEAFKKARPDCMVNGP